MWFRRSSQNRKLRRESVLEVKAASRETRRTRLRLASTAVASAVGTLAALYVIWRASDWALRALIYENAAYAIEHVEVQTDGILPLEWLRQWTGVQPGENLLALNLYRVQRDLELMPLVRQASVQRVPPNTLRVRVSERIPIAEVKLPQLRAEAGAPAWASYYLDEGGQVIHLTGAWQDTLTASLTNGPLPQLVGLEGAELRPGRLLTSAPALAALRLIAAFEDSPMSGLVELRNVDVSNPSILEVTTAQGNRIIFGLDRLEDQLHRWRLVHDHGVIQGKAIQSLDLSVTNNAPVVFSDAGAAPTSPPKSVKPSSSRKRHV
jgi:cell division septal protein FtsQ